MIIHVIVPARPPFTYQSAAPSVYIFSGKIDIDIFSGKKLEDIVPSSHNYDVPHVTRIDYQLIDIFEQGFVILLTKSGQTKDDLKLPTDEQLLAQIKAGFDEGKDLVVTVMSAMGEEQICSLKDIGPK